MQDHWSWSRSPGSHLLLRPLRKQRRGTRSKGSKLIVGFTTTGTLFTVFTPFDYFLPAFPVLAIVLFAQESSLLKKAKMG
jgi:hypothetical protein